MEHGDILGHEFMGEVVEVGRDNTRLKVGDRVVVPFTIACGRCYFCKEELWSLCDNSNPNAWMVEKISGFSPSGLFGYSPLWSGRLPIWATANAARAAGMAAFTGPTKPSVLPFAGFWRSGQNARSHPRTGRAPRSPSFTRPTARCSEAIRLYPGGPAVDQPFG